jgi:hypothetical protein
MDLGLHSVAHGGVNHAMSFDEGLVFESRGDNINHEVTTAPACSRVSGVFVAFIHDLQ